MKRALQVALAASIFLVAGCSGDDSGVDTTDGPTTSTSRAGNGPVGREPLVFWSTDAAPERAQATVSIVTDFTNTTGIPVNIVLVEEAALADAMASNAAAGTLPDVVLHPLELTAGWAEAGYLDLAATQSTLDSLSSSTFSTGALNLTRLRTSPAAVPVHAWGQVIVYRADLFEANGLEPPDTFARIEAAAEVLHDPANDFYAIAAPSDPLQVFTQHSFEYFAVANGCDLIDRNGDVALDSPACERTFRFYTDAITEFGAPGVEGIAETRQRYFDGRAAMLVWSTLILDELAGLRDAALPTCPECEADPAFLARNSGFVTALAGPNGAPAQYGRSINLGIGAGGDTEGARRFIEHWLSDGYATWLDVAPENRFPLRRGTAPGSSEYVDVWPTLETGVDRVAPLSDFYGPELAGSLATGLEELRRWGYLRGQGALVDAIYDRLPVPEQIEAVVTGTTSVEDAIRAMQRAVAEEQRRLGTR